MAENFWPTSELSTYKNTP